MHKPSPAFQGKYCLQVDNAQILDVQTQTLLVYLCEKLKNTRANVCMFFSWNTSVPAKQEAKSFARLSEWTFPSAPETFFVIPDCSRFIRIKLVLKRFGSFLSKPCSFSTKQRKFASFRKRVIFHLILFFSANSCGTQLFFLRWPLSLYRGR